MKRLDEKTINGIDRLTAELHAVQTLNTEAGAVIAAERAENERLREALGDIIKHQRTVCASAVGMRMSATASIAIKALAASEKGDSDANNAR